MLQQPFWCLSPERHSMMDLAKLKYASQLQEGVGLPTCVQVIVPAVNGSFSNHATNPEGRGWQREPRGPKDLTLIRSPTLKL